MQRRHSDNNNSLFPCNRLTPENASLITCWLSLSWGDCGYLHVAVFTFFPRRQFCKLKHIQGEHSDYHQPSGVNKKDTCRCTTGGEQHDAVSPSCSHKVAEYPHCTWMHSHRNFKLDPVSTLTCAPLLKKTTQPTLIAFFPFSLLKRASCSTSIRDTDWWWSLFQQEATQPSAEPSFLLHHPIWIFLLPYFLFGLSSSMG